jgi:hypothetical protein
MLEDYKYEREKYTYIDEITNCIKQRIDLMLSNNCKVLFVRFDVRFPTGTIHLGMNEEISRLMKDLMSYYYHVEQVAAHYIWVREQCKSDAPHYHVIVLLNGSKFQQPTKVWAKAAEIWSRITNGPYALVQQCWAKPIGRDFTGGIKIRRPTRTAVGDDLIGQQQEYDRAYGAAIGWGAYLAKESSKDNTPPGVRRYGSSQL